MKQATKKKSKMTIALCSSATFFKDVLRTEQELKARGFMVEIPHTAGLMRDSGDYRVETYKTWFKDPRTYPRKAWLMKHHFAKIKKSDAILVVNKTKNGVRGYLGGATLMEMTVAFHYKKPIYLLHAVSPKLPLYEEIMGMLPVVVNGDIKKIKR